MSDSDNFILFLRSGLLKGPNRSTTDQVQDYKLRILSKSDPIRSLFCATKLTRVTGLNNDVFP